MSGKSKAVKPEAKAKVKVKVKAAGSPAQVKDAIKKVIGGKGK